MVLSEAALATRTAHMLRICAPHGGGARLGHSTLPRPKVKVLCAAAEIEGGLDVFEHGLPPKKLHLFIPQLKRRVFKYN